MAVSLFILDSQLDGIMLSECAECANLGTVKSTEKTYPCSLCGQLRCIKHAVWVPSHILDRPLDHTQAIVKLMSGTAEKGWYAFCGRPGHIPRGMPMWYGKEREGGKIVEEIMNHEKPEGLEMFPMWEVGIVEEGGEQRWSKSHYEISCDIAGTINLVHKLWQKKEDPRAFMVTLQTLVFENVASKKPSFFGASMKEMKKKLGDEPSIGDVVKYVCERCAVVACLNRQAPFHDQKLFKKLIKKPELLLE
ncbi:MAG: hypothetical protein ACFFD6_03660 [Candidatus Thorarchaeota archaeon]